MRACKSVRYFSGDFQNTISLKINDSYKLSAEINTIYNDFKTNDSYKLSRRISLSFAAFLRNIYMQIILSIYFSVR